MKAIFFSDVHLERHDKEKTSVVTTFIRDVCAYADFIFILGDLFEFFYGYRTYIYPWYLEVIDSLKRLTEEGRKVFFLEGNHEFQLGNILKDYAGIECARELSMEIDGKKVFLAHGNEFIKNNPLRFLKSRFVYSIMEALGPDLTWKIAMLSSIIISDKKKPHREDVKQRFRTFGKAKLDDGFDVVIFAHTHMPDKVEFEDNHTKKLYLNTGDLFRYHSYLAYETQRGFEIKEYKI
ncbi:MAG TPA: UDP-2,3-diacylglucosamine diphosphatase [Syntrophorhabdaceae bacterium]|nr:UDP-2,3-diacylglucosamine diphosphatase [Syntrophorhabdaceae bacterium]HPP05826.1 UDP-2,3-diacylglucosamine diphosphatase [Syntrophorhabdaceae bacterium]